MQKQTDEPTESNQIEKLIENAITNIKAMVDTNIVIGKQIEGVDNKIIVPVSKVSVGFVAGGGEYNKETTESKHKPYAGGSGAGFSVTPIGFLVASSEDVSLLKISQTEPLAKLIETIPCAIKAIKNGKK